MNFTYTPERLAALSTTISLGRLAPYMAMADNQLEAALRLYQLNASLSAALYGPLQTLEVTVRNSMDRQLTDRFGATWDVPGAILFQKQQRDDIDKAVREISVNERGAPVDWTHDQLVAELNFGFWVGALNPKNDVEVWRKALWKSFPNRPKGIERKDVQGALNSVRRLRNRVAHHCRIIHRDLVADHRTILEVLGWICVDTRDWTESLSQFNPDDIPGPQQNLPMAGMAEIDPIPPATPVTETRDGRLRLSMRDASHKRA